MRKAEISSKNVWVDDEKKVISFHFEDGFRKIVFYELEEYEKWIQCLGNSGYRYQ